MYVPLETGAERWLHDMSDAIVAAGRRPALWRDIPSRIADAWPGTRVLLHGGPTDRADCLGLLQHGFEPEVIRRYEEHYCHLNPWNLEWRRHAVLHPVCSNEALPWPSCAGTEFYDDFFAPLGDIECAAGIKLFDEPDRSAWLGMHYGSGRAGQYDQVFPHLLRRLAPVIRAALSLNRELRRDEPAMAPATSILETFTVPALIVDRRGAPQMANLAAGRTLDRGDLLRLDMSGRVRLSDGRVMRRFTQVISRLCRPGGANAEEVVLRSDAGRVVALLSLYPIDADASAPDLKWLFEPERLVLLILRRSEDRPRLSRSALSRLYGLTPAEAGIPSQLASGESLAGAADALGISKETARVHLKAVFAKTDTHRQAELVALLAALTARH